VIAATAMLCDVGGATRCPDCQRFVSPAAGHICPSQNRSVAGASLGVAAVAYSNAPTLPDLARGEHELGGGPAGHAEVQALYNAAHTISEAQEQGLHVPLAVAEAADAYQTSPSNDTARAFAAALVGTGQSTPAAVEPPAGAAPRVLPPEVRQRMLLGALARARGDVAQHPNLIGLANGTYTGVHTGLDIPLDYWSSVVERASANAATAGMMTDAMRSARADWADNRNPQALAAMICEIGGTQRCGGCGQFMTPSGHTCLAQNAMVVPPSPEPQPYNAIADRVFAAAPALAGYSGSSLNGTPAQDALDQAVEQILELRDAAPGDLRRMALEYRSARDGYPSLVPSATRRLVELLEMARSSQGAMQLDAVITRLYDQVPDLDGTVQRDQFPTLARALRDAAAGVLALPEDAVPAILRQTAEEYMGSNPSLPLGGATEFVQAFMQHLRATRQAFIQATAPRPIGEVLRDVAEEAVRYDAVLALANGVRDTSAFAPRLLQPYADAVERAAAAPGSMPEAVLEAARRWRAAIDAQNGTMDWEAAQTLAQAVAEHGGVNRCPDCGRFVSPHIGHLCTAQNHTMGGAAMGLSPVMLRTTPGLRGLARGEHQITDVGEAQDAEREALRRAWREVRGAFERREPVPSRLLIAGEYATRQPELDPRGAAMFARALLGEPEPPLAEEAMVAVRFMNRQRRAALRERNERPGLSHLDSAARVLVAAEGVPSTVREAARAHLDASGDDTEATGRTLAHHLANLADLYDGDRVDNRPAWTLDLPEVGNIARLALHDHHGVIVVANGGVSPGRETDQALQEWAQAVYNARRSGGTVPPLVMDAIDDLQSSDTAMYRRASVDIARYMALAAGAGQCVDCGRFVSPQVGHICPAQSRTASGQTLDLPAVTLTRLPVLREVATGPRTTDSPEARTRSGWRPTRS